MQRSANKFGADAGGEVFVATVALEKIFAVL
jgi:hypothetical protein